MVSSPRDGTTWHKCVRTISTILLRTDLCQISEVSMSNDEHYGIGPCMIHDLPLIKAENERKRIELTNRKAMMLILPAMALWSDAPAFDDALEHIKHILDE